MHSGPSWVPPPKTPSSPRDNSSNTPPRAGAVPHPPLPRGLLFWVKTLMHSLFSKRSPRGYKNSQQAPVSRRSLTFFHWEFVYSQP